MKLSYALIETKLGWLGVLGSKAGLLHIVPPQASPQAVLSILGEPLAEANPDIPLFGDLPHRLKRYLDGEVVTFPDPLDLAGATPFQSAVWQMTRSIPYGETRSYAWLARQIGIPGGARAVGQALAKNPLPIVVPCHRVIGIRRKLRCSRSLEMRRQLLEIEGLELILQN